MTFGHYVVVTPGVTVQENQYHLRVLIPEDWTCVILSSFPTLSQEPTSRSQGELKKYRHERFLWGVST